MKVSVRQTVEGDLSPVPGGIVAARLVVIRFVLGFAADLEAGTFRIVTYEFVRSWGR